MVDSPNSKAQVVRRLLFLVFLISLTLLNMIGTFRGLSTPRGMEYAQMGREVARGNIMGSKMITPLDYAMAEEASETGEVSFLDYKNTNLAPLHSIVLGVAIKVVGGDDFVEWQMGDKEFIYSLDRVVSGVSVLFFLLSIGVSYVLVSRLFDTKIAGVTALLMLLCNLFWEYTASGLPQMMMLFLFSMAMLFAYNAVLAKVDEKSPLAPALLGGLFLVLLGLTHWLTIWILLAYIIYCAVAFNPRGTIGIGITLIGIIGMAFFLLQMQSVTGNIFGNTRFVIFNGYPASFQDLVFRTYKLSDIPVTVDGLMLRVASDTLIQTSDLYRFLGSILAAPLFFLALLHVFRKQSIASFRWLILVLWFSAALGMALFGFGGDGLEVNQLHLLFVPVMTAYGLAFLSILWAKIEFVTRNPGFSHVHFVAVILISAGPLILALPKQIKTSIGGGTQGAPLWEPYWPPKLNRDLHQVDEKSIIVSDMPWATAWYTDRTSIWLPRDLEAFSDLENKANLQNTPFAGILISPYSTYGKPLSRALAENGELSSLVFDGPVQRMAYPIQLSLYNANPNLKSMRSIYRHKASLFKGKLLFYGAKSLNQP